jgi:hypothetical protein
LKVVLPIRPNYVGSDCTSGLGMGFILSQRDGLLLILTEDDNVYEVNYFKRQNFAMGVTFPSLI